MSNRKKLTRETKTVVLFQGDDLVRIDELSEKLSSAIAQQGALPATLDETDPALDAAREYDDFVTEATERADKIIVEVLNRRQWRSLKAEHPPRMETVKAPADGDEPETERTSVVPEDEMLGFNAETMPDALVPPSIAPGQFDTPADRDDYLDSLSDRNFSKIYSAAVMLNAGVGSDPKADASSLVRQMFAETSKSQDPSD